MFSQETVKTFSLLPPLAVLVPALGAIPVAFAGSRHEKMRNLLVFLASLATLGIVIAMTFQVFGGGILRFDTGLIDTGGDFSLKFEVDAMGAFFALIASTLWVAAVAHASVYMTHEENRTRFFIFLMVAEAATLGVFLVHDFFSLFIFFEIMGLAAYPLIIHSGTGPAKKAATKYLYMAVCGGLSLLAGIFLYMYYTGTVDFIPPEGSAFLTSPLKIAPVILLIAGFGVKAGLVPLHVWLPDAHPAAPSPASALLSGVMLKAGVYGIIRTVASFFYLPGAGEAGTGEIAGEIAAGHVVERVAAETTSLAADIRSLGLVLITVALITMLTGVVLAILQSDVKRTLAYSSISQVGFILFGAGCFVYLGEEGAIGLAGSLYHVVNHALFKGCLFLVAGSIVFRNHELNIFRLGGLFSKMRLTTLFWCIAAMGIAGIPLFNGFASKTLLHHAIVEAQHLAAEGGLPEAALLSVAEVLFVIACAGTVLYFSKLTYYIFFRKREHASSHGDKHITEVPLWMLLGSGVLAAGVIVIGIMPGEFFRHMLLPVVGIFGGLEASSVEHLHELAFFNLSNIKDAIIPFALGTTVFAAALGLKLFEKDGETRSFLRWPKWVGFNYLYVTGAEAFISSCFLTQKTCDISQAVVKKTTVDTFRSVISIARLVDGDMQLARSVVANGIPVYIKAYARGTSLNVAETLETLPSTMLDDVRSLTEKERELTAFIAHDLLGTYDVLSGTYHQTQEIIARTPEMISTELSALVDAERRVKIQAIFYLMENRAILHREFVEKKLFQAYSRLLSRKIKKLASTEYQKTTVYSGKMLDDISLGAFFIALIVVLFLLYRVFVK